MTFDEVIRNSRSIPNLIWTKSFLSFPERNRKKFQKNFFFPAEVNKNFPGRADFIGSVGKGETNKWQNYNTQTNTFVKQDICTPVSDGFICTGN
jgi:hypothetical protein